MRNLLPTLLLALLASACVGGFHFENDPYSELVEHEAVLRDASDLPSGLTVGGVSYDWQQGAGGFHHRVTCPAEVELDPGDLEAFLADLDAYLRDDIFGSGFHLDEEGCSLETRKSVPGLAERGKLELAWESATGKGRLELTLGDGARTGLYDLYFLIDESSL